MFRETKNKTKASILEKLKEIKAFSLIEIVVALIIIGIITAIMLPDMSRHAEDAKITAAKDEVKSLIGAIVLYKVDTGAVPTATTSSELCPILKGTATGRSGTTVGPWLSTCSEKDPWGNDYAFDPANMIVYTELKDDVAKNNNGAFITSKDLSKLQESANPTT